MLLKKIECLKYSFASARAVTQAFKAAGQRVVQVTAQPGRVGFTQTRFQSHKPLVGPLVLPLITLKCRLEELSVPSPFKKSKTVERLRCSAGVAGCGALVTLAAKRDRKLVLTEGRP
ncbi:MAG: hypothetical protein KC766_02545, partial [Myxococcales bacterium]|nr:hypothetical protein [Myxococcales bacterium]